MNGRFLLDTNIVIALFRGDRNVQQHLAESDEVFVSSVVLGELYFGALKSSRAAVNLANLDEFILACAVLVSDTETARNYGAIKHALQLAGRPIPENDIWVAAISRQHDLILITRDDHFQQVDGLKQET